MQAPVINSITFDKPSYAVGDTITATIDYSAGLSDSSVSFTGTGTDSTTGLEGTLTVNFTVADGVVDPTELSVSDSGGRTWTKTSDTGSVAVFTATA